MADNAKHLIRYPYDAVKPDVLVICCSDGRYIRAVEHFLFEQGIDCHDLLCLPGGPARLCHESASIFEVGVASDALDYLIKSHGIRRTILIGHAECGHYIQRYGGCDAARLREDLSSARQRLLQRHPDMEVSMYVARPVNGRRESGFELRTVEPHGAVAT